MGSIGFIFFDKYKEGYREIVLVITQAATALSRVLRFHKN